MLLVQLRLERLQPRGELRVCGLQLLPLLKQLLRQWCGAAGCSHRLLQQRELKICVHAGIHLAGQLLLHGRRRRLQQALGLQGWRQWR